MKIHFLFSVIFTSFFFTPFSFAQQIEVTAPKFVKPDSITIANGTKISYAEHERRCNIAWDNSFGKMTKEENDLLFGVPVKLSIEIEGEQPVDDTELYSQPEPVSTPKKLEAPMIPKKEDKKVS
jgi:hypothetical protein